jgi:hypothetical protein
MNARLNPKFSPDDFLNERADATPFEALWKITLWKSQPFET